MSSMYDDISEVWKNYISFLQTLSELAGLPVALWRTGRSDLSGSWSSCDRALCPCFSHEPLRHSLEEYCRVYRPGIFFENDQIIYGIMPIGSFFLSIGPASIWSVTEVYEQNYAHRHGVTAPIHIIKKNPGEMSRYLELAFIHFTGAAFSQEDISVTAEIIENWQRDGDLEEYQLDQSENDRSHLAGIEFENRFLRIVKDGDIDELKKMFLGPTPDYTEIADLSDETRKEQEYLVVSVIALVTRAAVAGGVAAETAHELGDVYLKRLAKAALRKEDFLGLSYNAMMEFTELVRRAKEEKSSLSHVDACKQYIEKNLRKDLQVSDIAPAIGLSRTYLSRLFHDAEGITVQQYIQKEKCRHAAQMLQYSDYSISQIAQYFSFSSQSYFGTCFQTWYGMTPRAYRKAHH